MNTTLTPTSETIVCDGALSFWASELIHKRLSQRDVPYGQHEEYYQHITTELLIYYARNYHTDKASLSTQLIHIIDKQIIFLRRSALRHEKKKQRYAAVEVQNQPHYTMRREQESASNREINMRMDVQTVLATMPTNQRRICELLAIGHSERSIAKELGVSLYAIYRDVIAIRETLKDAGLNAWIQE